MITELKEIISNIDVHSCPDKINLHTHTIYSDGSMEPETLIKQAINKNLLHLAVTDHHNIQAYSIMNQFILSNKHMVKRLPVLWSGIEISCILKNCLVHVLGLGFEITHKSMQAYTYGEAPTGNSLRAEFVVNSIHNAGGLAILAHPARYRLDYKQLIDEAYNLGFDGAEAWYDYDNKPIWHPTEFICEKIDSYLKSLQMLSTCGTDTHGLSLNGR